MRHIRTPYTSDTQHFAHEIMLFSFFSFGIYKWKCCNPCAGLQANIIEHETPRITKWPNESRDLDDHQQNNEVNHPLPSYSNHSWSHSSRT